MNNYYIIRNFILHIEIKHQKRVKMKINIIKNKGKNIFLISAIVLLLGIGYVLAYPYINPLADPGHGGNQIYVRLNGNYLNLQQSLTDDDFDSCAVTGGTFSGPIEHGHTGERVIVNVGGTVKTLQQAINDNSICSAAPGTSPPQYGQQGYGITADMVLVDKAGERNLQQSINTGDFNICECVGTSVSISPSDTLRRNGASPTILITFRFPSGIAPADIDFSKGIYMYHLGAQILQSQSAYITATNPTRVSAVFNRQTMMARVPGYGAKLFRFQGGLTTGYYQGQITVYFTRFAGD